MASLQRRDTTRIFALISVALFLFLQSALAASTNETTSLRNVDLPTNENSQKLATKSMVFEQDNDKDDLMKNDETANPDGLYCRNLLHLDGTGHSVEDVCNACCEKYMNDWPEGRVIDWGCFCSKNSVETH